MSTYVQSPSRHSAAVVASSLFIVAPTALVLVFGLGGIIPGLASDLDGLVLAGGFAAFTVLVVGLGWLVVRYASRRGKMIHDEETHDDAFLPLDTALDGSSAGEDPDRVDEDDQINQDNPRPPEPIAAQRLPLVDGYIAEMRDVLRRLNIQDPHKRRWFLWGVHTRFEVGLRLVKPRLSAELIDVHLDAFEAAAKAIRREELKRQQEIGQRA